MKNEGMVEAGPVTQAVANVITTGQLFTEAELGGGYPNTIDSPATTAKVDGAPTTYIATILQNHPALASAFVGSPTYLAVGAMTSAHDSAPDEASGTTVSKIDVTVDPAQIGINQELVLGLFRPTPEFISGAGIQKVTLDVTENGTTLFSKTLNSPSAALTFFTDDVINLGLLPPAGTVEIGLELDVTGASVGSRIGTHFLLGTDALVPAHSTNDHAGVT